MKRRTIARAAALALGSALLFASVPDAAHARTKSRWIPNSETQWLIGAGGDNYRTGYNPTERRPPFIDGGHLATGDADGPWLEWVTKISDLPSGIWPLSALVVDDGMLYVAGAATNSFLALDVDTGLPVWRFQPDPRTDGYSAAYPASNAPLIEGGVLYTTFSNGWLYALDAKTGRKIWSYRATEGYRDTDPGRVGTKTACPQDSPYRPETCLKNRSETGPVHPGVDYPKIHGATGFCEGNVLFMTLSGWVYSVDADTGKLNAKRYLDGRQFPGELVWPEFAEGGALNPKNRAAGMSTRRFEAVPGLACLHGESQIAGSDGQVRFVDPKTLADTESTRPDYTRRDVDEEAEPQPAPVDFCINAGFNCDIAVGIADPKSGDYILTTLDARIIRLDWRTHRPEWRRHYLAPFPFEQGNQLPIVLNHLEHGFIVQGVTGGQPTFDPNKRTLYLANQDGYLYVMGLPNESASADRQPTSCPPGFETIRPEPSNENPQHANPPEAEPCLIARVGMSPNKETPTPYTRGRPGADSEGGPWDYNQHALSGLVLGGDVVYGTTWDNKIIGFDVRNPRTPKRVWEHEIKWDPTFRYPPFGDTFAAPFADIDLKSWSSPALVGGRLFLTGNDGSVYAFSLQRKVETKRNLVILGSGAVPFLPEFAEKLGTFDRVWTPADWYKNQVAPAGYRFPRSAGLGTASALVVGTAAFWWWARRREEWPPDAPPEGEAIE